MPSDGVQAPVVAVSVWPTSGVVSLTVGRVLLTIGGASGGPMTRSCGTAVLVARVADTATALPADGETVPAPS